MHELSLVQGLMSQVLDLVERHRASKVLKITVAIGPFSGVVADSFRFAYEILSQDYAATKEAVLEIQEPKPTYRCNSCGYEAPDRLDDDSCPRCEQGIMVPRGGDELILLSVEME